MRWVLTAEHFIAAEAVRISLAQEVTSVGVHVDRAGHIAERVAAMAPARRPSGARQWLYRDHGRRRCRSDPVHDRTPRASLQRSLSLASSIRRRPLVT
jgi:enoyl-CoA hydratase/carnithine racemase